MAATTEQLIHNTLRYFNANYRPERNKLAAAVDASTEAWTFDYPNSGIKDGARVSCELEDVYVWSTNDSSQSATVERGQWGSTAAAHADGALVFVNPVVSWFDVLAALNDDLLLLSSPTNGVWRVKTDTFTFTAGVDSYDLATDVLGVASVAYDQPGISQRWVPLPRDQWEFDANADATDFPAGKSLTLLSGGHSGRTVRVTYRATFSTLSALADVPATVTGLPARAHQIIEMGAALRLAAGRPIKRSFTESQGDPRRAEEVTVVDAVNAPGRLAELRQRALDAEAANLRREYGF